MTANQSSAEWMDGRCRPNKGLDGATGLDVRDVDCAQVGTRRMVCAGVRELVTPRWQRRTWVVCGPVVRTPAARCLSVLRPPAALAWRTVMGRTARSAAIGTSRFSLRSLRDVDDLAWTPEWQPVPKPWVFPTVRSLVEQAPATRGLRPALSGRRPACTVAGLRRVPCRWRAWRCPFDRKPRTQGRHARPAAAARPWPILRRRWW